MRTIGQEIVRLATVDSTNKYAAKGLSNGQFGHGAVIMAHAQTAGEGQRGHQWHTAPGLDIALSVVLLPKALPAMGQFAVAKAAALAVHDTVAEALQTAGKNPAEARIKWPNDVLIGRNKVAGILIVNELLGSKVVSSIAGIGINVNSTGLDSDLAATSLLLETGIRSELEVVLAKLCASMERWWGLVENEEPAIASAYSARLWAKGRFAEFIRDGKPFHARPLDVDAAGRLLVEEETGKVAAYGLERLRFVR